MNKSVDLILSAVKSAGEAALRLHEENESLTAECAALRSKYDRLAAAARKVTCGTCYGTGEHYAYGVNAGCPDCTDLRRELEGGGK